MTAAAEPAPTLDATDREILASLWQDARRSNRQIADDLGVSEGTVRARIKRMISSGRIRIQAITNIAARERPLIAVVGLDVDRAKLRRVAETLAAMPEVGYVGVTLGRYDLMALVFARDPGELRELLVDRIRALPGVRRSEASEHIAHVKFDYRFGRIQPPEARRPARAGTR